MCGICGYVGLNAPEILEPMCLSMVHRGPDDMGTWHDPNDEVGLGHRRLSIIDLSSAGHQPMSNENDRVWISYNGEIYNFQEHRERLQARGHQFKSRSDTEVLIHLYEESGLDFLSQLNGIFALAIWDKERRQLLLARDHAGVKPLYYWQNGHRLFFASEIKALLRVPGIPRALNANVLPHYMTFLWVPGKETMFKDIKKLEPGHCLLWKAGRIEVNPWFSITYEPDYSVSESEWVEQVHDTFMRTTQRQMVSDVPLGAFLSGGTDSSSIVACMREAYPDREICCYTVSFSDKYLARDPFVLDYPYACRVAERFNVKLKSINLDPDIISMLPKMIYYLDEPDADPAVFPSYLISKLAREDGMTVLLSGTGGDEIFFGYRSHQAMRLIERMRWIPRWLLGPMLSMGVTASSALKGAQNALPRRLKKFRNALMKDGFERYMEFSDWSSPTVRRELYAQELKDAVQYSDGPPDCVKQYYDSFQGSGEINRRSHVLIQTFLGAHNFLYTDKSSMATSIEVRVPFMDVELMRLCARIPEGYKIKNNVGKYILKKSMERYLPSDILYRSKTGFGAPLRTWIAEDLSDHINELLGPKQLKARGLFNPQTVQHVIEENRANKADHTYLIYCLLNLEL